MCRPRDRLLVTLGVALLIVSVALCSSRAPTRERSPQTVAASLSALELAAIWWFQSSIDLDVSSPGLAWRTFLALYTFPLALTLWRDRRRGRSV